jgi:hypothetical protein
LSLFDELRRREAADTVILMPSTSLSMTVRICAMSHSSAARPRWLLCNTGAGILFNEHVAEDGPVVFAMPAVLAPKVSFRRRSTAPIGPVHVGSRSRSAVPPASPYSASGASFGIAPGGAPSGEAMTCHKGEMRACSFPLRARFRHSSPSDGIQPSVISCHDIVLPAACAPCQSFFYGSCPCRQQLSNPLNTNLLESIEGEFL